jgi:hypothetical protein
VCVRSCAVAVAQSAPSACPPSFKYVTPFVRLCLPIVCDAFGVFHAVSEHEASLSPVRRSHIGRANSEPLRIEPERGKAAKQSPEPVHSESCDVLHEHVPGSHDANDVEEGAHEVSLVVAALALPCVAVWLAGDASTDEIHATSELGSRELVEITRPDRGRIHARVLHPCQEDGRCVAVPLTETHQAGSGDGEAHAALEAADPCAHAENAG